MDKMHNLKLQLELNLFIDVVVDPKHRLLWYPLHFTKIRFSFF